MHHRYVKSMEHSDRDLIERSLRGHTGSFSMLVDRYRRFVFGICLAYTRDGDAAEDLAQEAFVKAYLRLRDLSDPDRFSGWLRQITVNECHRWHRDERRGQREVPATIPEPASPEEALEDKETRRMVFEALSRLTDEQRQVVILFYQEGSSLKQIARFLGISAESANQRLYRARRQLKQEMMGMIEETLGRQGLPEEFTGDVLTAALERGQELLHEKRWPEARAEFRSILARVEEHVEAQRGLAEALGSEVDEMLANTDVDSDDRLVNEAMTAYEEAHRLGARDSETVWNLAEIYNTLLRDGDRADLLEEYAAETADPHESFKALHQAGWSCRVIDPERSYFFFRQALSVEGIEAIDRLESYFAAPMKIHFDMGHADTWLQETEALFADLSPPLTTIHYMYYRDRIILLAWLERFDEALANGREYHDLLDREPVSDPVQRQWWICDTWAQMIEYVYGPMKDDEGLAQALKAALDNLDRFEAEWKSAVAAETDSDERRRTNKAYGRYYAMSRLGCACREAGKFDEAIPIFERALQMREHGLTFMHLAITHMRKLDRAGALEVFRRLSQSSAARSKWTFTYFKSSFEAEEDFEAVRDDPEFLEVVEQIYSYNQSS